MFQIDQQIAENAKWVELSPHLRFIIKNSRFISLLEINCINFKHFNISVLQKLEIDHNQCKKFTNKYEKSRDSL